ncbi:MAG: class I SAM-dependent methyltransferase [Pseudonocardia sp.]|nr:class I SAM-dependent methyltransferase [Pseudonocardia sp.]
MSAVQGDTHLQSDVLEDLAGAVNYRRWLCSLGVRYFGSPDGEGVLEIGSGLGYYAADWADLGVRITASEADPERLAALRTRFADDPRVGVRELTVPIDIQASYDAVVAYNVLEHIPDHVGALRAFRGLVRTGGAVVLVVPAFPFAMSDFDRAIGHQRRYTVRSLRATLGAAGLRVQRLHYVNAPGLVAWTVMMRLLRQRPGDGALLSVYDKAVVPVMSSVEKVIRAPFGQSVFAVARR